MSKIKVGELRELDKKTDKYIEKEIQGLNVRIKTYLPIEKKIELVYGIYHSCVNEGTPIINPMSKEVAMVNFIVSYYTNLNLPKDTLEGYDLVVNTGIYEDIVVEIIDEIDHIEIMLEEKIEEEQQKYKLINSISHIIKNFLNELIDKVPSVDDTNNIITKLIDDINLIDPNNLKFVQEFIKLNNEKEVEKNEDKNN